MITKFLQSAFKPAFLKKAPYLGLFPQKEFFLMQKGIFPFSTVHQKVATNNIQGRNISINQAKNEDNSLERFLSEESAQVLRKNGINYLFPIQRQVFEFIQNGEHVIVREKTGSGKTLAYALPIIENYRKNSLFKKLPGLKFIVLVPTRELAFQVFSEINKLKTDHSEFRVTAIYGGERYQKQSKELARNPDIVVATPGRLMDMIKRGEMEFQNLQTFCLDEADYMLQIGFHEQITNILECIKEEVKNDPQYLFFSATIPPWLSKTAYKLVKNQYKYINLIDESEEKTATNITHHSLNLTQHEEHEFQHIVRYVIKKHNASGKTLIFTETKRDADRLGLKLGLKNVVLHSDINQSSRNLRMEFFKKGRAMIMIATNVASRGLDIPNVQLVIQCRPPQTTEPFIHRSGRTGRAGKEGMNIVFYESMSEKRNLKMIEREANIRIKRCQLDYEELVAIKEEPKEQALNLEERGWIGERKIDPRKIKINNLQSNISRRQILEMLKKEQLVPNRIFISTRNDKTFAICQFETEEEGMRLMNLKSIFICGKGYRLLPFYQ